MVIFVGIEERAKVGCQESQYPLSKVNTVLFKFPLRDILLVLFPKLKVAVKRSKASGHGGE